MEYEIKLGIAIAVGFALMIRGYVRLFSKGKGYKHKFIEKAKEQGHYKIARCVATTIRGNSADSSKSQFVRNKAYFVKYEYEVEGKKYYKTLEYQNIGSVSCQYPIQITVYYDKKNPKKSYCANEIDEGTRKSFGCLGTIVFSFGVMWIILNLL